MRGDMPDQAPIISKLYYDLNRYIAYCELNSKSNYVLPTIIFLSGFNSDMNGSKASALADYCASKDYGYLRFDYFGHGASSGHFIDGTIGRWLANTLEVIDKLTSGQVILIGSSMGGWLMLLAALARPEKIAGLIGIAAAPDFTEELIWHGLTPEQQDQIASQGQIALPNLTPPISYQLITEARSHLLLHKPININCPVYLLHGMQDQDVPYTLSIELAKLLTSSDVTLKLVKSGDHRLSRPEDIKLLTSTLDELLNKHQGH